MIIKIKLIKSAENNFNKIIDYARTSFFKRP